MNKKWIGLRFMVGIAVLLGIYLLVATQSAAAVGQTWAKWKIQVNFQNNVINPRLVVQIGHTTVSGVKVIDQEGNFWIPCSVVGNPIVQNNKAIFNGSSYYQCVVPSIQLKVSEMTGGAMIIPDSCDAKRPYLTGILSLEDNPIQPAANNPLFYREDISFNLPLDTATGQAQLVTSFDQATAESNSFVVGISNHTVTAVYNKTPGSPYTPAFTVDTVSYTSTPATISQPIFLSTLESTVYFGYSPATGEYFEGILNSLVVDPYCVGTG